MSDKRTTTGGQAMQRRFLFRPATAVGRAAAGFTLLEVMIVLALIGLIAGTIGVGVFKQYVKGQAKTAKISVKEIGDAVTQYMIENNNECPKGMEDLVAKKNLKKSFKDPWGKDFIIKCPGTQDTDGADVISTGPDKQEGTTDDIKSWD
jgi:general secretion pathway protein G